MIQKTKTKKNQVITNTISKFQKFLVISQKVLRHISQSHAAHQCAATHRLRNAALKYWYELSTSTIYYSFTLLTLANSLIRMCSLEWHPSRFIRNYWHISKFYLNYLSSVLLFLIWKNKHISPLATETGNVNEILRAQLSIRIQSN